MQRDTRQRRAIRNVFMTSGRPLTPDEVLSMGQRLVDSLGLATVYRNIKILYEEGWLAEVDLPGGGTRPSSRGPTHRAGHLPPTDE